jgi:(p)ppGpp synthase/HD superfamily hydrolase
MLSEYYLKTDVIVTAILHDVVEDCEATVGMIVDAFSWRIAEMVDRLTRDRPDGSKLSVEEILNNAYAKDDKEVLLIKVVDRLHNMHTIGSMGDKKQNKIAIETLKSVIYHSNNIDLEKLLNILSSNIIFPENVNYLKRLYSKRFFSDNFQLPSLS